MTRDFPRVLNIVAVRAWVDLEENFLPKQERANAPFSAHTLVV